jgi:hypothetical protein
VTSYFPRGRERVKRKEISMNFATETATATAAKNNTTIWPGITSAPSARPLSLVLNMSPDICDPVSHSASAPRRPRSTLHTDTGDRPYKCQHCGDQFARRSVLPPSSISRRPTHLQFAYFAPLFFFASDLLSRHVNKCHPNEKPLVSSTPSRRKGTSSTSRATTSKQACDQCVQSTLPCDGANPCCQ